MQTRFRKEANKSLMIYLYRMFSNPAENPSATNPAMEICLPNNIDIGL
jgi:hypothetical protein